MHRKVTNENGPIRIERWGKSLQFMRLRSRASVVKNCQGLNSSKMSVDKDLSNFKISCVYV